MSELAFLSYLVYIRFFFTGLLTMQIVPTMNREAKKDISGDWVDQKTLGICQDFSTLMRI